jgi:hypothetical protein
VTALFGFSIQIRHINRKGTGSMLWRYEIYLPDEQQLADEGSISAPDFVEARKRALKAPLIMNTGRRKYEVRLLNENGNIIWIGRYQNAARSGRFMHRAA